jgi:NDP-sugar pyrophosphorylase family protein
MQGVILAAGRGTRMRPFSPRYPKPVLPVGNRPLLARQIEAMRDVGIAEVIVVIGHLGYEIVREIGDGHSLGVEVTYAEQQETLGIAHAVGKLEDLLRGPFLLFLGDIYFEAEGLAETIEEFRQEGYNGVVAVKREDDPEAVKKNFAVLQDDAGRVYRVIEKPRHVESRLKGCGIYLFDLHIFDAIRRTPRTAQRDEYEITDSIQILIDYGMDVRAREIIREDVNLSDPADLLLSNLLALKRSGEDVLLGGGVAIHPEAAIERSVIGAGVRVESPVAITESLVFPGARIRGERDIHRSIITPDTLVPIR